MYRRVSITMAQPSSLLGDALFDVVLCAKAFGGDYDTTTQVLHTEHDRLPISHSANRVGRNGMVCKSHTPDSSRCHGDSLSVQLS